MTKVVTEDDIRDLQIWLSRLDSRAPNGAWTCRILEVLKAHPGIPAGDICDLVGQAKKPFKINVPKLMNRGLTESLGTGYP